MTAKEALAISLEVSVSPYVLKQIQETASRGKRVLYMSADDCSERDIKWLRGAGYSVLEQSLWEGSRVVSVKIEW